MKKLEKIVKKMIKKPIKEDEIIKKI